MKSDKKQLKKLLKQALHGRTASIRFNAIRDLSLVPDENSLIKVALDSFYEHDRCEAINFISDQTVLNKIALNDEELIVRRAAVRKLTDTETLHIVLEKEKNIRVRDAADERLKQLHVNQLSNNDDIEKKQNISKSREDSIDRYAIAPVDIPSIESIVSADDTDIDDIVDQCKDLDERVAIMLARECFRHFQIYYMYRYEPPEVISAINLLYVASECPVFESSGDILIELGILYSKTKMYDQAIETYKKAIPLSPQHRQDLIKRNISVALEKKGR